MGTLKVKVLETKSREKSIESDRESLFTFFS